MSSLPNSQAPRTGVRADACRQVYSDPGDAAGRIGQARGIASIVTFPASDDSRWPTGERLHASGGML